MNKIDKESLYKMFHDGRNVSEMASAFKCTKFAIYYSLHQMNLKLRNRNQGSSKITMIAMTYAEIEKLLPLVMNKKHFRHLAKNLTIRSGRDCKT